MSGEVAAGLAVLEQGWQAANVGEHWMDAELHRLKGELLRIGSAADLVLAEQSFRHALAVAEIANVPNAGAARREQPCAALADAKPIQRSLCSGETNRRLVRDRLRYRGCA